VFGGVAVTAGRDRGEISTEIARVLDDDRGQATVPPETAPARCGWNRETRT